MIVSIDLGISTTKIVHRDGKSTLKTELIEERLDLPRLVDYVSHLETVSAIAVTGVGSQYIGNTLCGKPVVHVDEFEANTLSARNYVAAERFILVSMGTGTSFILVDGDQFSHLGGSALGGGTLQGMMRLLLPGVDFPQFRRLAAVGDLSKVDLQIGDVSPVALPNLPMDTTASNLGKIGADPNPADLAAGLVNLVLQNIGVMANLAGKGRNMDTFCFIGLMTTLPKSREIFDRLENLYGIHIIQPEHPEFFTAVGAALKVSHFTD